MLDELNVISVPKGMGPPFLYVSPLLGCCFGKHYRNYRANGGS